MTCRMKFVQVRQGCIGEDGIEIKGDGGDSVKVICDDQQPALVKKGCCLLCLMNLYFSKPHGVQNIFCEYVSEPSVFMNDATFGEEHNINFPDEP